MDLFYVFSYNNLNDNKLYNINNNINNLKNNINNLNINIDINSNIKYDSNEYLEMRMEKNFIKKANFYVKKNKKTKIYNNECYICLNLLYINNCERFNCNHLLCKECYNKWNIECTNKNIDIICPICK